MDLQMCFDFLQRQLRTDFSDKLLFNYALAASALPFENLQSYVGIVIATAEDALEVEARENLNSIHIEGNSKDDYYNSQENQHLQ
ncbi:hypothetical protein L1887_35058 [Cichorium endivia]|nr:hypothetical protein L1887_35058 [Cichorium endivia]